MEQPPSLAPQPTCCCSPDNGIWNWRGHAKHTLTHESLNRISTYLGSESEETLNIAREILPMPAQNGKLNQLDKEALAKLSPNLARQTALHIQPRHEISGKCMLYDQVVLRVMHQVAHMATDHIGTKLKVLPS